MEDESVPILRSEHQHDIEMRMVEKKDVISVAPKSSCDSVCRFLKQENHTSESKERSKSATKLCGLIIFYVIAMLVEVVGGFKANSLAVMTDAAHLLMDIAGFSIALFAVRASGWEATLDHSFGFSRLEVLGALLSVQLIWLISGILIYEATVRMLHKSTKVNGALMFGVAAFGLIINVVTVTFLGHDHAHHACGHTDHDHDHDHGHGHSHSHDHDHSHSHSHNHDHDHERGKLCTVTEEKRTMKTSNINLQGAYLHVVTDLIQSVGVMIAGSIMWKKPDWYIVDLFCTFLFSIFALSTTIPMLSNIFGILMERTPTEINVGGLESDLMCIHGVKSVHDLHVWSITSGKIALSCHVVAEPEASSSEILHKIIDYCQTKHRIHHVTVQVE
ncbi:hypothetical protein Ddye_023964 [Dipteronia dyeriana]|uniref:Uncharacterized protein n=1 Tax=Dipteronia dyeriana TaxID=168575 RepID=A0AAD9TUJ1_9ROSI|nr:hypothetical protein Ddye_023964 [Dipteronia dyeriana]